MDHEMGCPFAPSADVVCAAPIAHIKHWQSTFTAVVVQTMFILVLLGFYIRHELFKLPDRHFGRLRIYCRKPTPTTYFQELYSNGILNTKVF